jgi:flagellar hook protein FlgE
VANQAGLARSGSNDYVATNVSGAVSIGIANAGGRGSIDGEALEQSNVDISAEFSNLIVAQRAFEANSKTVTTFDSVTQEAIGMIR